MCASNCVHMYLYVCELATPIICGGFAFLFLDCLKLYFPQGIGVVKD